NRDVDVPLRLQVGLEAEHELLGIRWGWEKIPDPGPQSRDALFRCGLRGSEDEDGHRLPDSEVAVQQQARVDARHIRQARVEEDRGRGARGVASETHPLLRLRRV